MDGLKIPVALVFAMAIQLVALVWYISNLVHDIEHLQNTIAKQQDVLTLIDQDLNDLWTFCTFTENKWAESYTSDMVYERVCGTKEFIDE